MGQDLAASVRARLLNIAKAEQTDFRGCQLSYAAFSRLNLSSRCARTASTNTVSIVAT